MHDTGGTHRATAVVCPPPPMPYAQPHPEHSIRPETGKPLPMPARPGTVRSRGHPPDCGRRAPSRPAPPHRPPPPAIAACPPQRRAPSAAAQPLRRAPRAPARSLTREAAAASPLWLLAGFRTQAATAAASTIPAADAGTVRPPSRVPSAPRGRSAPHRAPPPAAAAPAAMARRPRALLCLARLPRSPVCGAAAATAAAMGRASARLGHFRVLPAGADAVTGGRCGLPRRRDPSLGAAPSSAASGGGGGGGGGRAPGGTGHRGWRMGGGEGSCGRALAWARLALIHGRVHVLLCASECLAPGRPTTAFPKGEIEARKKGSAWPVSQGWS